MILCGLKVNGLHTIIQIVPRSVNIIIRWSLIYRSIIIKVAVEDFDLVLDCVLCWS